MKKIWTILCLSVLFTGCAYDDADVWESIDEINKKIKALEEKAEEMNGDISSINTIVNALNTGKTITAVTESASGYTVTFSDGSTISVMSGGAGANIPVIGVKEDSGVYYWTITKNGQTEWLTGSDGNKFPVAGVTPQIGVDSEGYWTIDTGNGPVRATDEAGNPIKAAGEKGDSFFESVTQNDTQVIFTLNDGTEIVIPKAASVNLIINGAKQQYFYFEESRRLTMELTGTAEITISKPDGWRIKTEGNTLTITAPAESNPYAETEGEIAIIAIGETTAIAKIRVVASAYQAPSVLTFEDVPAKYLAGPTSYGENLYSKSSYNQYEGDQFTNYTDPATGLKVGVIEFLGHEFYYGGSGISRWNDMVAPDYKNQCSVYYSDPTTGKGGNNGSETFAIVHAATMMGPNWIYLDFDQNGEYVIDHLYVSNNTYGALSMLNGDGYAKRFTYEDKDYFLLTFQGFDAGGKKVGSPIEYYLADFRTPSSPGVITGWHRVDLSAMGKINKLGFWLVSTDGKGSQMSTPAYFCLDDIAVRP